MSASLWFLSVVLVLSGPDGDDSPGRGSSNQFKVEETLVTLIEEIDVAAEEAGLITEISVREGSEVKSGDKLAQINDSKAQAAKKVAKAEHEVALAEATNNISVRYAEAAAKVAEYDYRAHFEANKKARAAVPDVELKKLLLTWHKGELETEKAQLEFDIAGLTAKVKEASVEAAEDDIERRQVFSRIDAMVMDVYKHANEWVNPGDRLLRLVRMKKVRVEGRLKISDVYPTQVNDRPVTVESRIGNRTERFQGKVVFVAPELGPGGKYRVIAEVENREDRGAWLLLKGMNPTMTVDAGVAADKPKTQSR